jgi:hypothetical protein
VIKGGDGSKVDVLWSLGARARAVSIVMGIYKANRVGMPSRHGPGRERDADVSAATGGSNGIEFWWSLDLHCQLVASALR